MFIGRTDAEAEIPILWQMMQRTDSLEKTLMLGKMRVGGEGDDGEWGGWMASTTLWTWVWVSSGSWWWTGKPGALHSMGSQRVGHIFKYTLKLLFLNIMQGRNSKSYLGMSVKHHLLIHLFTQPKYLKHVKVPIDRGWKVQQNNPMVLWTKFY